ncbi:glycosyltransferase family 4 protein [Salidesulfovibrio brasiliensis]|uniref:glycosyltransferase family 4 protein n=1 Tax=Salidesulfovibrio brasiliensis TaxID=221711 RepID=UPI0006CFAF95|nr:glycosyltransferase family 4 protein [Salidesulfovibrio brasiliensis]
MNNILFVETGIVGGGSFESLYQTVRSLDRDRFTPVVAFLNRTHYLERMRELGVTTYLLTDLAYTKSLPKVIHGNVEKRADKALSAHPKWGMALFRMYHGPVIRGLKRIVAKHGIDLLYLNDQINRDLFGCLVARDCGIPLISHLRSMDGGSFTTEKAELANQTVDAYISNSTPTKKYWESRGISKGNSHLVYNAVSHAISATVDVHKEFSIPDTTHVIGSVARLIELKNLPMLVDAFAKMAGEHQDCVLLFLGDGPQMHPLQKQAEAAGLSDRIIFAGHRPDARELMGTMDMVVLPSRNDSFGRVLIEAMQARTPVIGADSGGIVDIIEHGQNGFLLPHDAPEKWAEAMHALLTDEALRQRFIDNGLKTVSEKFDLAKQTERIQAIIGSVLQNASKPQE